MEAFSYWIIGNWVGEQSLGEDPGKLGQHLKGSSMDSEH